MISTGRQDFRSKDGLYSKRFTYEGGSLSGPELFDVATTQDANKLALLNKLMTKLRIHARTAPVTSFHRLVVVLHQADRLQRCYTQNFDGLQTREHPEMANNVVELHGSNEQLFCHACGQQPCPPVSSFDSQLLERGLVGCPHCQEIGPYSLLAFQSWQFSSRPR